MGFLHAVGEVAKRAIWRWAPIDWPSSKRPKGRWGIGGHGQAVWVADPGEPSWQEMDERWRKILLDEFDRQFIPLSQFLAERQRRWH